MRQFDLQNFSQALTHTGIEKGDLLFIHSALLKFGIPNGIKLRDFPAEVFHLLIKQIGPEGTLVVPTFNFDFCDGKGFDRQETPAKNMGVFAEFVRQLPESKRSVNPMQSVAAVGRLANRLVQNRTRTAFSPGSAFDQLLQHPCKVLLLGADFGFNSAFHWVEEKQQVPYRYWKDFTGQYKDGWQVTEETFSMYVRDLNLNPQLNFDAIERALRQRKHLKEAAVGDGKIRAYKLREFIAVAERKMKQNPYFFIANHPKFEKL